MMDKATRKTVTLPESDKEHPVGDAACRACWMGFPVPCERDCRGLVHATFGDENFDGDYWISTKCDMCGGVAVDG